MSNDAEKIYKVTLPDGQVVSAKAYYGKHTFDGAVSDTDTTIEDYAEGETPVNNWFNFRNQIGGETFHLLRTLALQAQLKMERLKRVQTFEGAVQELCVISHLGFDPTEPMRTLQALIQWNVQVALDPSVSESQAHLYKQILDRNEFLARKILPILDDVPTANLDLKVLELLKTFIEESPGDRPVVYDENWLMEYQEEFKEPEDAKLLSDVEAGRRAAAERQADKPKWLLRKENEKARGRRLFERRKLLNVPREMIASLTHETVNTIRRIEQGLPTLNAVAIRNKMKTQLTTLERLATVAVKPRN